MTAEYVDLFAGPGGWDLAARSLGFDPVGIELDEGACATRRAAGLPTIHADVAALEPGGFAPCAGLIASAPCPSYSTAGKGEGALDMPEVEETAYALATSGEDLRDAIRPGLANPDSLLVVEPLRWTLALEPTWVALEQVPSVLPFWRYLAELLEPHGYHTWAGLLEAADYGVPQTRTRAILLAHRGRTIIPPEPTHADPRRGLPMFARPWVSMGEACGWASEDLIGFPRRNDRPSNKPSLGDRGEYRARDRRPATLPAFTLTEKARSWTRIRARGNTKGGRRPNGLTREITEPSHTVTSRADQWRLEDANGDQGEVTIAEAAALQAFPPGHPFAGSRTAQFRQVANAIPPLLARRLLEQLT